MALDLRCELIYYDVDNIFVINIRRRRYKYWMYEIKLYETPSGRVPIDEYYKELARDSKTTDLSRIELYLQRLKDYGPDVNRYHHNTIKKIQGDVFELRPGNHRIFYFYFSGNEIILLHAFRKSSQKTPKKEIKQAIKEMKDHKRRNGNG